MSQARQHVLHPQPPLLPPPRPGHSFHRYLSTVALTGMLSRYWDTGCCFLSYTMLSKFRTVLYAKLVHKINFPFLIAIFFLNVWLNVFMLFHYCSLNDIRSRKDRTGYRPVFQIMREKSYMKVWFYWYSIKAEIINIKFYKVIVQYKGFHLTYVAYRDPEVSLCVQLCFLDPPPFYCSLIKITWNFV